MPLHTHSARAAVTQEAAGVRGSTEEEAGTPPTPPHCWRRGQNSEAATLENTLVARRKFPPRETL